MIYKYSAKTSTGETKSGTIDSPSMDIAVGTLQRMGLIIIGLEPAEKEKKWWDISAIIGNRIKPRDIVIISRQLSTLFEAKVPIITSLRVLSSEASSPALKRHLEELTADIQGGLPISSAMAKHPEVFSNFYVNMVRSGEEAGKLEQIFMYLADYLERSYELQSKVKNALLYPAFVLVIFVTVMSLMLVIVIPKLSAILKDAGQEIPIYTRIVIGISDLLMQYGIFILLLLMAGGIALWRYTRSGKGAMELSNFVINIPIFGALFRKFYLSRLADNLNTLISGGVPILRALEITADVVGNEVYAMIMRSAISEVKSGAKISDALGRFEEIPRLFTQMIRVGEETGKVDFILGTLARFYRREVDNVVSNLVSLIEPLMIVLLGLGVGVLVASVLIPIYSLTNAF